VARRHHRPVAPDARCPVLTVIERPRPRMPADVPALLTAALGWLAAIVSCFISTPQLARIVRAHSVAGVSRLAWQLALGGNLTWGIHGLVNGNVNQWVPNVLLVCCTLTILGLFRRHHGTSWLVLVAPGLLVAATTITLELTVGVVAYSIAAFLPAAVSLTAQLRATATSRDVTGISLTNQWLGLFNQSIWLCWALLAHEPSVIMVGSAALLLLVANVMMATLRKSGRVGPVAILARA